MDWKSYLAKVNCYVRDCWHHLLHFTFIATYGSCTKICHKSWTEYL